MQRQEKLNDYVILLLLSNPSLQHQPGMIHETLSLGSPSRAVLEQTLIASRAMSIQILGI